MRVIVDRVSKTYRDGVGREVPALQEVSLTVEPEEFVAILGPSGCGKSTLLNIIAGLLPATAGAVHFEGAGRPGAPLTATSSRSSRSFPWRTVRGNVGSASRSWACRADRAERARRYLNLTELPASRTVPPHSLAACASGWASHARSRSIPRCF